MLLLLFFQNCSEQSFKSGRDLAGLADDGGDVGGSGGDGGDDGSGGSTGGGGGPPNNYTYSFLVSPTWGPCSATVCGTSGIKSRTVTCLRNDGATSADSLCPAPIPDRTMACSAPACPRQAEITFSQLQDINIAQNKPLLTSTGLGAIFTRPINDTLVTTYLQAPAGSWVEIDFGDLYAVKRIKFTSAPQNTDHTFKFLLYDDNGLLALTEQKTITAGYATIEFATLPYLAKKIRVEASGGTSEIYWKEIEVLGAPIGIGLKDQGIVQPVIRTDFNEPTKGTINNPTTRGTCLYPPPAGAEIYCPTAENFKSFGSQSNAFYLGTNSWPMTNFWLLDLNNEDAHSSTCNSGPPNQSLPAKTGTQFGTGVFNVKTQVNPANSRQQFVLSINNRKQLDGCEGQIPWLSVGSRFDRGNGGLVPAVLNRSSSTMAKKASFTANVTQFTNLAGLRFWTITSWGGKYRMFMINLFHNNLDDSVSVNGQIQPAHINWSWPTVESYFYNGAEIAILDAEDVQPYCATTSRPVSVQRIVSANQSVSYNIDIEDFYKCLSEKGAYSTPIPTTPNIPVYSIHWAAESANTAGSSPGSIIYSDVTFTLENVQVGP